MRYLFALLFALPVGAAEFPNPFQEPFDNRFACHNEYVLSLEFYGGRWRYIPIKIMVCEVP